jgi:hypothetical protein
MATAGFDQGHDLVDDGGRRAECEPGIELCRTDRAGAVIMVKKQNRLARGLRPSSLMLTISFKLLCVTSCARRYSAACSCTWRSAPGTPRAAYRRSASRPMGARRCASGPVTAASVLDDRMKEFESERLFTGPPHHAVSAPSSMMILPFA